jgi:hypothetical protein
MWSGAITDRWSTHAGLGQTARMSIPTPGHYLPALYVLGAQRDDDALSILTDGIELGSISMLSFGFEPARLEPTVLKPLFARRGGNYALGTCNVSSTTRSRRGIADPPGQIR